MAEEKKITGTLEKKEVVVPKVNIDMEKVNELVEQNKRLQEQIEKLEKKADRNPKAKLVKESSVYIKMFEGSYVIGITPETGCKKTIKAKNGREYLIVDIELMDTDGNITTKKDVSLNDLVASNKKVKVPVMNFYREKQIQNNGKVERVVYKDWSSEFTGQEVDDIVVTEKVTTELELPNGEVVELKSNVINL